MNHVRAVLAGSEYPIDLVRRWIVGGNGLGSFGREPQLAANERDAMRGAERTEVDRRQGFHFDEIDRGDDVAAAVVVGNVGHPAIGRGDHLVRIWTGRHLSHNFQRRRIHHRQRPISLGQDQQRAGGRRRRLSCA